MGAASRANNWARIVGAAWHLDFERRCAELTQHRELGSRKPARASRMVTPASGARGVRGIAISTGSESAPRKIREDDNPQIGLQRV